MSVEQTVESVAEAVTNTTTPEASAGVLLDWIISTLHAALGSSDPAAAVKAHADTLEANKTALAAAVAATPA